MISTQSWIMLAMTGALVAAGVGLRVQTDRLTEAKEQVVKIRAKYDAFVENTRQVGEEKAAAAKKQDAEQKAAKEKADAEQTKLRGERDRAYALYNKLRHDRENSGGGTVSSLPTNTADPNKLCFDRTKFATAVGILEDGVPRITAKGDSAIDDLNGVRKWAQELPHATQ